MEKRRKGKREENKHRRSREICEREGKMGTTMAGLAPGLSRKLKKVLESRTDTPDVLNSLNTLSTFYTDNTPQSRRNLRSTIEKRSLSINIDFLRASDTAQLVLSLISTFLYCSIQLSIAWFVCSWVLSLYLPIRR